MLVGGRVNPRIKAGDGQDAFVPFSSRINAQRYMGRVQYLCKNRNSCYRFQMNRRKRPKGNLEIGFSAGASRGDWIGWVGDGTKPEFFI